MPDWLVPDWPLPAGVRSLCTTRDGGVSVGACQSLNLGGHVGDDPASVRINRARLEAALGAHPVFLQQVHGTGLLPLDGGTADGAAADACTTTERGVACTIMVADCLPVLFTDAAGARVAAAHAGWRGLAAGIAGMAGEALCAAAQCGPEEVDGWLGACIGADAFEVGADVLSAFGVEPGSNDRRFKANGGGKWLADLAGLTRDRLRAAGVERVSGGGWCTVSDASRFFSFRRDGVTGRMAAAVWLHG